MVAEFATGSEMSKRRPPGYDNGRVQSEVGSTESVNAGSIPDSTIEILTNNKQTVITGLTGCTSC